MIEINDGDKMLHINGKEYSHLSKYLGSAVVCLTTSAKCYSYCMLAEPLILLKVTCILDKLNGHFYKNEECLPTQL